MMIRPVGGPQPGTEGAQGMALSGKHDITLQVNGESRSTVIRPADLLLHTLGEQLGLTGTKPGCDNGDCVPARSWWAVGPSSHA